MAKFALVTLGFWPENTVSERTERRDWHKVVILDQDLVRLADEHLYNGTCVLIEGKLQTHEWRNKEGKVRCFSKIVLHDHNDNIILADDNDGGMRATADK